HRGGEGAGAPGGAAGGRGLPGAEGAGLDHRAGAGGGGGDRRQLHPRRGQAGPAPHHPHGPAQGPGPGAEGSGGSGRRISRGHTLTTQRRIPCVVALLLAVATTAPAAEVAILKSSEVLAWRPTLEALRRVATGHSFTEYDLHGDRAEAERVLNGFKGKAV